MSETQDALMRVMQGAAYAAGRALKRDLGELENLQRRPKGPGDFVSAADLRSEKILRESLEKARPGFSFLTEEGGETVGEDPRHRWIIDPLDGTTNFLHGLPFFAISLALEHRGRIIAGLVYNPATDEMFRAQKGRGAFLNDRRIRASGARDWGETLVATGVWKENLREGHMRLMRKTHGHWRRTGSSALNMAYVAAGRLDVFTTQNVHAWDLAAGIVLVREAGGLVSDMIGGQKMLERGEIIAARADLHGDLQKILRPTDASEGVS